MQRFPSTAIGEHDARVSSTALVAFDRNRYSVHATAVGNTVTVRAYADRITFVQDGRTVGIHRRHFGRDKVIFDPWHYLEALKKKPGALRNGAPFKEWNLPEPVERYGRRLPDIMTATASLSASSQLSRSMGLKP